MSQGRDVTKEDRNKAAVLRYVEAFNRGDIDAVCAQFTPDAQVQSVLGFGRLDDVRPLWRDLIVSLGVQLHVEDIVAEGDHVAVRYRETGASTKPFRGKDATGHTYELVAMEWFEMRDGRIARRWTARDTASQARQLGFSLDL